MALGSAPFLNELRFSRQILTLGREATAKIARSHVLILGAGALGSQIATSLALAGVGSLTFLDDALVKLSDLGAHCLLKVEDIGRNRASASASRLRELGCTSEVRALARKSLSLSSIGGSIEGDEEGIVKEDDIFLRSFSAVVAASEHFSLASLCDLDRSCRERAVKFVMAGCFGFCSYVFSDFGEIFEVRDPTGEPWGGGGGGGGGGGDKRGGGGLMLVESITQDFPATVTIAEDQRHNLESGDFVVFSAMEGMQELNDGMARLVTVTGPSSFTIPDDARGYKPYGSGGYISYTPRPIRVSFLSLEDSLLTPQFADTDSRKPGTSQQLHAIFRAVDTFENQSTVRPEKISVAEYAEIRCMALEFLQTMAPLPTLSLSVDRQDELRSNGHLNVNVTDEMVATGDEEREGRTSELNVEATEMQCDSGRSVEIDEGLLKCVLQGRGVELSPLVSLTGGIAAHEILKACTGVLMPLRQWLYFDATDCLPEEAPFPTDTENQETRYSAQISMFGGSFQELLADQQWLIAGAGAIGCEVLKNLALMGIGSGPHGRLTIVDPDTIQRSNLATQMFYQMADLHRAKAPTAARAIRAINSDIDVRAIETRLERESEGLLEGAIFESLSGILCAVDNATSRLYIDSRCVYFRKPMVDGGKYGVKGSVQVFVPHESEMYASSRDPPEHKEAPICTLKNFPYAPDHTIKWAVESFSTIFTQRPEGVNSYLGSKDFAEQQQQQPKSSQLPVLQVLYDALVKQRPLSFEACVEWARLQFEDLFVNTIKQLIHNFPPHMTTTAGVPFWSGTKRAPKPQIFNPEDSLHLEFIVAAANLQAQVYGLKGWHDKEGFLTTLKGMTVPPFEPKEGVKIAVSDNELRSQRGQSVTGENTWDAEECERLLEQLPSPASLAGYRLTPLQFDPDDEKSFAAEFIVAAANLRAKNYDIPSSDKLQARLAGARTIPAMATTAAVVGGLMCLEVYKLALKKPLTDFHHSYFNLAVPLFVQAQPRKAIATTVATLTGKPLVWTLWDRFDMDGRGLTLESFLATFKEQYGLEISMVSHGKSLLYAEFLNKKKIQERLPMALLELVSKVGKTTLPPSESSLNLSIACIDASGEDIEVPDVVLRVR